MKTIFFDKQSVALMIRVALVLNPRFVSAYSKTQLRLMACGRMRPGPQVLDRLNLTPVEGGFEWHA